MPDNLNMDFFFPELSDNGENIPVPPEEMRFLELRAEPVYDDGPLRKPLNGLDPRSRVRDVAAVKELQEQDVRPACLHVLEGALPETRPVVR